MTWSRFCRPPTGASTGSRPIHDSFVRVTMLSGDRPTKCAWISWRERASQSSPGVNPAAMADAIQDSVSLIDEGLIPTMMGLLIFWKPSFASARHQIPVAAGTSALVSHLVDGRTRCAARNGGRRPRRRSARHGRLASKTDREWPPKKAGTGRWDWSTSSTAPAPPGQQASPRVRPTVVTLGQAPL